MKNFVVVCKDFHVVLAGPWDEAEATMVAVQASLEAECEFIPVPLARVSGATEVKMGLEGHQEPEKGSESLPQLPGQYL